MRDFWTNRKQQATDIVSERITVRYRQLIEEAVRRLIEEELEERAEEVEGGADTPKLLV